MLTKIPPYVFAFIYLFLILMYAFIYYKMPNNFYQSTIQYERYLNDFSDPLEDNNIAELDSLMHLNFKDCVPHNYLVSGSDTLFFDNCHILPKSLEFKNDSITFELWVRSNRIIFFPG